MDSVSGRIKTFEKPTKVEVEYTDGFVSTIDDCVAIYARNGLLQFEQETLIGSRFRSFRLESVYKFVIFSGKNEKKEGSLGSRKLPTFVYKK